MNLTLVTEGSYLHVKDKMIEVQLEGRKQKVSPQKIERILVTTRVKLSSDVVILALEHKIEILFLDHFGDPKGRIWFPAPGSTSRIRKRQLEASLNGFGLKLVLAWLTAKLQTRADYLQVLAGKRPKKVKAIRECAQRQERGIEALKGLDESADPETLRGIEGSAGRAYFQCLAHIQPAAFPFSGRSFRPAHDPFNCLLNYAYGVLYGYVEKACIIAGIDPHIGFLHRDGYNHKSFVYDFIEPYRIHVERVVVSLFSAKRVKRAMFTSLANGVVLEKEGKRLLLDALTTAFDSKHRHGGRLVQTKHIIQLDAHQAASSLLEGVC